MGVFLYEGDHRIVSKELTDADIQTLLACRNPRDVIVGIAASLDEAQRWAHSCQTCRNKWKSAVVEKLPGEVFPGLGEQAVVRLLRAAAVLF